MEDTKRCVACGLTKSLSQFNRNRSKSTGISAQCKSCTKRYNQEYKARLAKRRKPLPTEKKCGKCLKTKPASAFKKHTRSKDGLNWYCRKCVSHHNRLVNYGITEEQYAALLKKQDGVCAACGADEASSRTDHLFVDHCHKTDRIRGLLCSNCNFAIGLVKDDPDVLRNLALYLESCAS